MATDKTLNARPETIRIDAYQGDTFSLTVFVTDSAGDPYDLTGIEARMTVRRHVAELEDVIAAEAVGTIDDPVGGVIGFLLLPEDVETLYGSYVYDIQLQAIDATSQRETVAFGQFNVAGDVTRGGLAP